jgi:hypothetical protein
MIPELLQTKHLAPSKKFRNQPRYFRKAMRAAGAFELSPVEERRWDYWHYHADWDGYGNLSWDVRLAYLGALAIVFRKIALERASFETPFQLWMYLSGNDAGQDTCTRRIHTIVRFLRLSKM